MSRRRGEFRVLETPRQYSGMIISRLINARTIIIKYADAWTEGRLGVAVVASSRRATTMPLVRFRLRLRIIQINCAWTSLLLLSFRASPGGLLSLSLSRFFFFSILSLSLADSSQVEALRGRVESPYPRTTSAVFHSPQPPTPRGEAAHPPLCVSERTPVRSGTLFCNIVLLEPRNAASRVCGKYWRASNIKKYTTLAPLLWSKRSLLLLPPAVYLIPSLFPFYNTRLSFSLSLSVFACFFLLRGSNDFYYYLLSNSLG